MDQAVPLLWTVLLSLLGSLLCYGYNKIHVIDKVHIGSLLSFSKAPSPSPLPTKIQRPFGETYRVQGLPLTVDVVKLQSILQNQYRLEDPSAQETIRVGSLAEAPDGRTLVATVSFFQVPLVPLAKSYNVTIDDEFVGLTTLYCPKKEEHKVDIIAVSGLGGHAFGSFKERGGHHMWLRDSLPYDLGSARIFVYGYDSHLVGSESFQELDDLSTTFRDNIREINRDPKFPKPFIFVAHSLGGLLVKGAIIQMHKNSQEDRKVLDSTCGLLFFGVPNSGLDIESLLPMVDGQPNEVLLRSLGVRTQLLRDQSREFSEAFTSEASEVICFYETKLSPTAHKDQSTGQWKMNGEKKVLVDRDSATHGRSYEEQLHKTHPINCNHSDMVKFSSNDNNYNRTLKVLEDVVNTSKKFIISRYRSSAEDETEEEIFSWLCPPDPTVNYFRARDLHEPETGKWILIREEFLKWRSEGGVLWLYGIPGSGKTIASSSVIDSILQDVQLVMAYYFFDFNDKEKQTLRGLLLSLLKQLAKARARISASLENLYTNSGKGQRTPDNVSLKAAIRSVLDEFSEDGSIQIFLILDALDECKEEVAVLSFIHDIRKTHPSLHIYIASRPESEIRVHLEDMESVPINLTELNGIDIDIYVKEQIQSRPRLNKLPQDTKYEIQRVLLEKASGMFRWAVCQLDALEKCRKPKELEYALDNLPVTLEETYERALAGIQAQHKTIALRVFQWLLFAHRPLFLEEIAEILVVNSSSNATVDLEERLTDPRDILEYSGTLISVQDVDIESCGSIDNWQSPPTTQLRLAHFSVKEYFLSDRVSESWKFGMQECHEEISGTCINYLHSLKELDFKELVLLNTENDRPLIRYAGSHWSAHYASLDSIHATNHHEAAKELLSDKDLLMKWLAFSGDLFDLNSETIWSHKLRPPISYSAFLGLFRITQEFLEDGLNFDWENILNMSPLIAETLGHPIISASSCGHKAIVELLLKSGVDVDLTIGGIPQPLWYASELGQTAIVELLLRSGADANLTNGEFNTALVTASSRPDVVELLLRYGADANLKSSDYGTPLYYAAFFGHTAVVELLLRYGADVNLINNSNYCRPVICAASGTGRTYIVDLLLKHGAVVNPTGSDYATPLYEASSGGHTAIVELLLKSGADVNLITVDYDPTPLGAASLKGYTAIVELLLRYGADVNLVNGGYGTPLSTASYHGHTAIVEMLLEHGADINPTNDEHRTPLCAASENGSTAIVEMLLRNGADINPTNGNYRTPLCGVSEKGSTAIAELLLRHGADINQTSEKYGTPLAVASEFGNVQMVRLLLERGAIFQAKSKRFANPLQATFGGFSNPSAKRETAELLIASGEDVNSFRAIDKHRYQSALSEAIYQRYPSKHTICLLLVLGVKAELSGAAYEAAIRVADKKGYSTIVELLQRVQELDKDPTNSGDEVRTKAIKRIFESLYGYAWWDLESETPVEIDKRFSIDSFSEDNDGIDSWGLESFFSS